MFYDLSVSRNPLSKPTNREICKFRAFDFLNCESTFDLTDVPALIYDRLKGARPFDTIHEILRCLSLVQTPPRGRNAPIWDCHVRLSGTDRLKLPSILGGPIFTPAYHHCGKFHTSFWPFFENVLYQLVRALINPSLIIFRPKHQK